jgi:hypothetical protein
MQKMQSFYAPDSFEPMGDFSSSIVYKSDNWYVVVEVVLASEIDFRLRYVSLLLPAYESMLQLHGFITT